jgi:hypothetical protein
LTAPGGDDAGADEDGGDDEGYTGPVEDEEGAHTPLLRRREMASERFLNGAIMKLSDTYRNE